MIKSQEKSIMYNNAIMKLNDKYENIPKTKEYYKKLVFYGVKSIYFLPKIKNDNYEYYLGLFHFICYIKDVISELTPSEFVNIFPIQKIYDGEKFECKDYFYTINYLKTLSADEPIGGNVDDLLWEYVNSETRIFNTKCFMVVDKLRKFEGHKSMMEEWADMNGITTYSLNKGINGKEYLYNKKTGKTLKVCKKRPKHLKLIK